MGFFSELKQDLSQAVNELMPEEEKKEMTLSEAEEQGISLEEMVSMIDNIVPETETTVEDTLIPANSEDEVSVEAILAQESSPEEEPVAAETESEPVVVEDNEVAEISLEDVMTQTVESIMDEAPAELTQEQTEALPEESAQEITAEDILAAQIIAEETVTEEVVIEETVAEEVQEEIPEDKGERTIMDSFAGKIVSDETSVITNGMTVTGDISSEGSLDVIGTVKGNIEVLGKLNITGHVTGDSKASEVYADGAQICGEVISEGAVKIGASSVIIGNIKATSAAIAGAVKGDIDVQGPVILDASAIVMGNIKSKSVQINNGAVIEGMCSQCYADVNPTSFFDDYKMDTKPAKKTK